MKMIRLVTSAFLSSALALPLPVFAEGTPSLAERLSGRILLQAEAHGEAYYVEPVRRERHYLGRPVDAFVVMTELGLGIGHRELAGYFENGFPARLSGRILLDVESEGHAFYVDPLTLKGTYLGTPQQAFDLMRINGLGITNADLALIPMAEKDDAAEARALELHVFNKVNVYRVSQGRPLLTWNDRIADEARAHSLNMAEGTVAVGHGGFADRVQVLRVSLNVDMAGENVAVSSRVDPVDAAVDGWIASQEHRENILNPGFDLSGVGIARSSEGVYYFTQIFIGS